MAGDKGIEPIPYRWHRNALTAGLHWANLQYITVVKNLIYVFRWHLYSFSELIFKYKTKGIIVQKFCNRALPIELISHKLLGNVGLEPTTTALRERSNFFTRHLNFIFKCFLLYFWRKVGDLRPRKHCCPAVFKTVSSSNRIPSKYVNNF